MSEEPNDTVYVQVPILELKSLMAELEALPEPNVRYKMDPLEFCREAHTVKDSIAGSLARVVERWLGIE